MATINARSINTVNNRRNVYDPYAVRTQMVNGVEIKYQRLRHANGHLILTDLADEQQVVEVAKALYLIGNQVPRSEWGISKTPDIYFRGWYWVWKTPEGWRVETHTPSCE